MVTYGFTNIDDFVRFLKLFGDFLTKTEWKLAEILQILSIALFEQVPLQQVLTEIPMKNEDSQNHNNCHYSTYNRTVVSACIKKMIRAPRSDPDFLLIPVVQSCPQKKRRKKEKSSCLAFGAMLE